MKSRLRSFVSILVALAPLLLSCGGDGSSTAPPVESGPVSADAAHAVSKSIGSEGGSISTTASNGTHYTLEVPAGAMIDPVKITMTPVLGIKGLGLSGGFTGAVELQPPGLHFAEPAILHITTVATPGVGERIAGFSANGDLSKKSLSLAGAGSGEIIVVVQHFSLAGAGFGTSLDVSTFSAGLPSATDALTEQLVSLSPVPWDTAARASADSLLEHFHQQTELPGLVNVSNDEELALAIEIYNYFRRVLAFANGNGDEVFLSGSEANLPVPTEFQDDVAASLDAAAIAIKDAIDGNNTLCADNASFAALKNVLYWQQQAETLGIATADNGLDRATLKLFLCVDPVIEGVELPAVMQDGFPHSLDVTCGLRFGDGSPQGAPFQINVTATGADVQHPTGFTDSQGHYTTVITATGNEAVTVNVQACLVLPGTTTPTFICETAFDVSSQGLDLTGDYIGTGPLGFDFTTMHVTQNQNAVSGSFESRSALEHHTGTFTATLSGTQLLGVDIELDGGACAITAPGFTGDVILDGNRQTVRLLFDGHDCHGHSMGGIVVCGPHSSVNAIDLSGQWLGSVALDIQDGNLPVTLQLTGGIGHVTGSFTGGRSGSFSADIVQDPNPGGCVFAKLTNIAIDFSDCPLIKSNLELEDGCVEIRNGTVNMSLSTHAQWADGCNHRDFTGFSFVRQVNICTGN